MRIALFFSDSHPPPPPSIHSSFFDTKDISLPNDVTPPIPDNTADDSLPPPMPTLEELNALKSRQLPATDYDNLDSELSYPYSPSINVTGITFSTPIKLGGYFPEFFEDTDPLSPIKEQPPSDYQTMGEALTTLTLTKPKQNTCAKQLMFVNRQSKTNQTKPSQKQTIEVEKYKLCLGLYFSTSIVCF